jgi:hypothetical protein
MSGSYSLREIDAMRAALHERELRRRAKWPWYDSVGEETKRRLEGHLRTYMQAGVDPQEIIQAAKDEPYLKDVLGDRSDWKPE